MLKSKNTLGVPVGQVQSLAVSDGDLHVSEQGKRGSSRSLHSRSNAPGLGDVASWAVGFERLLEDPTGVQYFTKFLKSEVSAENIFFWQACEKFRKIAADEKEELTKEARSIYDDYLSDNALHAINIDDTARTEERDLENPRPEMFDKAQQQIFKLMKFDSYPRFIRSPLYRSCMVADVEGQPLPGSNVTSKSYAQLRTATADGHSLSNSKKAEKLKKKVKIGKSLPFELEDVADRRSCPQDKTLRDKQREKRGSWGAPEYSERNTSILCKESQCSVKSTNSLELGSFYSKAESRSSNLRDQPERYCCVYLPDGTASLAPIRSGQTIRDMLAGMCEKRGFPLNNVVIYLQDKEKNPLSLDQDSSVIRDQHITLELRVTFTLEITFMDKSICIMAKSSKTLLESLSKFLQKHNLRQQDIVVTMSGKKEPLDLSMSVLSLADKKLQLDKADGLEQAALPKARVRIPGSQERRSGIVDNEEQILLANAVRNRTSSKSKRPKVTKSCELDGLIDLLSRATCQVDDQRGLLTKEHLVLPDFLKLPETSTSPATTKVSPNNTSAHANPSPAPEEPSAKPQQASLETTV